jgi:phosphocarrier protein HPr
MAEREIDVVNRLGLHARAAAKLVHLASGYRCAVTLVVDGEEVDAKSILGILLLAASQGTRVVIRCDGDDEEVALAAIAQLFATRFGESE